MRCSCRAAPSSTRTARSRVRRRERQAEQKPVQTGLANNGWVEITGGLTGDEQVVVVGQGGLKTGTAVKVVDTTAPAAGAARPGQGQVTASGEPLAATPRGRPCS